MMAHIYIVQCSSYIKYGFFHNNNFKRIFKCKTYSNTPVKVFALYEINQLDDYDEYKEYDKIISHYGKDTRYIEQLEIIYKIKLPIMKQLNKYLLTGDIGQELMTIDGLETLKNFIENELELFKLNIVKIYTEKEINQIKIKYEPTIIIDERQKRLLNIFQLRPYQDIITTYIYNHFKDNNNLYLNLATGGGKSFIVFNILKLLLPDNIIIFSPRQKINEQNISKKYIDILNDNYITFNMSKNKKLKTFMKQSNKKIIICCTQSADRLYNKIKDYNLDNVLIWFDEAHWGVDNWIVNKKNLFWLDNNYKKFFTSASPDESFIKSNKKYFGEYYKPYTVKYLIENRWLCLINTYMYETPNDNTNIVKYLLEHFTEHKKNYGFSFHSSCLNAFNLFYKHYKRYIKNKTTIKPFLLVSKNDYVKDNLHKINLDYDFMDYKLFEENKNSIAYVVKQYDMGYDFSELDFITFSDPKMSGQDIIQCIGRGTRPDKLDGGKNLNKKCDILLPIFINDNDETEFDKITNVLLYLIKDCGIDFDKVICNNYKTYESESITGKEYDGEMNIRSKLVEKLKYTISTTKRLYIICIENNIYNEELYEQFKNKNPFYKMKKNIYDYKDFKWKNIVGDKYYKTYEECNQAINTVIENIESDELLEELEDYGMIKYNEYDNKIPPYNKLKKYYY
jgi:superfamily II DNA or RNA helicase